MFNGILWVLGTDAPGAPPARALPALPDLPPSLPAVERERALDEILRASAEDLKGRGGFELSECFVDGTFVGTRKGADRWNRTSGTTSSWHGTHGAGRPLWSSYCAFDTLGNRRLEIRCDSCNLPSARVAERAGFQLEGELRNNELDTSGHPRDTLVYTKIPEEHKAARGRIAS